VSGWGGSGGGPIGKDINEWGVRKRKKVRPYVHVASQPPRLVTCALLDVRCDEVLHTEDEGNARCGRGEPECAKSACSSPRRLLVSHRTSLTCSRDTSFFYCKKINLYIRNASPRLSPVVTTNKLLRTFVESGKLMVLAVTPPTCLHLPLG
jgi:hypothetical protein